MDPAVMNSESLPTASSPKCADNTKVLSRRMPGQGETIPETLEGETLVTEQLGGRVPTDTEFGGHSQFGPKPNSAPET